MSSKLLEGSMKSSDPIQIVDLFAGPGGLGEGFSSSFDGKRFNIIVSAEADPVARQTLRLRAFYRLLKNKKSPALQDYYDFCNGYSDKPWSMASELEWEKAGEEARCITLGTNDGDIELDEILDSKLDKSRPWVLIGGPPCQAYSLAGRSRNRSKANYTPESDHRHFLYKEYLRIIQERQPAVFVMENVKGILSSRIDGESIFQKILQDLSDPDKALGVPGTGKKYRICSFVSDSAAGAGVSGEIDPREYIIRAEKYGIPQARHRVILLGIAVDCDGNVPEYTKLQISEKPVSIHKVIDGLPKIRSRLTKQADSDQGWLSVVLKELDHLIASVDIEKNFNLVSEFNFVRKSLLGSDLGVGALRFPINNRVDEPVFDKWFHDSKLEKWLNHDARGHMVSDLRRYIFASCFAKAKGYSPKGHLDFNLPGLAPAHKNWESGKFSDRFRVQCENSPSTTITSHISKDGHYFIHYDPVQCRSLSAREAARLQTFPDNYFFQGNRSQQYHQVGNAVPPLLAYKMASVVSDVLASRGY
ncbi:DNA cytosine methyltransferase [Pseudomonas sp. 11/12A]|uniref:DNA cytosine methyltransferase n=1 Tax=Pseudomonas sp. 11/12A TaxID=1506582 RepID=UPI001F3F0221|nr:DNA cytosine methyltransferase [Pseudomonas sp. 11/12A]